MRVEDLKVFIITCHDVYNVGASLQAYALQHYLEKRNVDSCIIDYKPEYLSGHYNLWKIGNPKYNLPLLREIYLLAKLPGRMRALYSRRKRRFDDFRKQHLKLTKRYGSYQELYEDCPLGNCYIAGSDQIWNPIFQNGKDPAFFLQFTPKSCKRIAYAASLGISELSQMDSSRMYRWLKTLDAISIREKKGREILKEMGIPATYVCDPVFLLNELDWEQIIPDLRIGSGYILLYDFDRNPDVEEIARRYSRMTGNPVYSLLPTASKDIFTCDAGPLEFLSLIKNASLIITNSYHAIVFSLLFQKDFYSFARKEPLNIRLIDLLEEVGVEERFFDDPIRFHEAEPIQWHLVKKRIEELKVRGMSFLERECLHI